MSDATRDILAAANDHDRAKILGDWLSKEQPCIFGRVAAQRELISYCFLTAADLEGSDEQIATAIQTKRRAWQSLAEDGRRSAFIILAVSEALANATPDPNLQAFALRLGSLYLRRGIEPDRIYHDRIRLWELGFEKRRQWRVGANVFAAAGDRRWWHDHRIPGGLGFSMNSVGHLVTAEARRRAIQEVARAHEGVGTRAAALRRAEAGMAELQETAMTSLDHALKYAMHTILKASEGSEGPCTWDRATMLLRAEPGSPCKIDEIGRDPRIREANVDTYIGWYHTDVTVPSVYFRPDRMRPVDVKVPFGLDFTYLHSGRGKDFREIAQGIATDRVPRRIGKRLTRGPGGRS
jgi:hypothetical protein